MAKGECGKEGEVALATMSGGENSLSVPTYDKFPNILYSDSHGCMSPGEATKCLMDSWLDSKGSNTPCSDMDRPMGL